MIAYSTSHDRRDSGQRGFSLIEVLVSLGIFSVAAVSIANNFVAHQRTNTRSEVRTGGILAAQQVLDALRVTDPATLPSSGSTTEQITIGPRRYAVTVQYCKRSSFCTTNTIRELSVEAKLHGSTVYAVETVYSQLK